MMSGIVRERHAANVGQRGHKAGHLRSNSCVPASRVRLTKGSGIELMRLLSKVRPGEVGAIDLHVVQDGVDVLRRGSVCADNHEAPMETRCSGEAGFTDSSEQGDVLLSGLHFDHGRLSRMSLALGKS